MPDGTKTWGTQISGTLRVNALLYAGDLGLICESLEVLTECVRRLETKTRQWGLTINAGKTKLMTTNCDAEYARLEIGVDSLERVDKFVCLGSMVQTKTPAPRKHKEG
ncbi:hypothetical protein BpHYR1_051021 [Brachionus plicatilis]|uniref:Reverse transcriptase domain-containing protein n=1 Tax=Brachionus plicatilis TaxID=10195 RepID=A0A3M7SQG2_BRAPC|nr:hypothetical protein BpHYR1_051021 [Brachionus plicatilis]